jgi:hypothetical protein
MGPAVHGSDQKSRGFPLPEIAEKGHGWREKIRVANSGASLKRCESRHRVSRVFTAGPFAYRKRGIRGCRRAVDALFSTADCAQNVMRMTPMAVGQSLGRRMASQSNGKKTTWGGKLLQNAIEGLC